MKKKKRPPQTSARAPSKVNTGDDFRAKVAAEMGVSVAPKRQCQVTGCTEEPSRKYPLCRTHWLAKAGYR